MRLYGLSGLATIGKYKLGGLIPVSKIFAISQETGRAIFAVAWGGEKLRLDALSLVGPSPPFFISVDSKGS